MKKWAYILGSVKDRHISEVLEGELFEWNGKRVYPVQRRFFRYEAQPSSHEYQHERFSQSRESAAHLVAKSLLAIHGKLLCVVGNRSVLLQLKNVVMEQQIDNLRPDITGIVAYCSPYWQLRGLKIHIEVHFKNLVTDKKRFEYLKKLEDPVLEFHLPKHYLRDIEADNYEPKRFRSLILAILTSGNNAGRWISATPEDKLPESQNVFSGQALLR